MEKNLGSQVRAISEQYGFLLSQAGCGDPGYTVCLDPSQGAGFIAENELTRDAMKKIPSQYSGPLLDSLMDITRCLDRTYSFSAGPE